MKITTVHADLSNYEPEAESLTGIVAIFAHLPPGVRKRVHAWIPRALRPGGVFILEAYTPQQIALNTGGPRNPELLMTLADLREELSPLTIETGREVERQIDEGSFHAGTSATVQVVAVRRVAVRRAASTRSAILPTTPRTRRSSAAITTMLSSIVRAGSLSDPAADATSSHDRGADYGDRAFALVRAIVLTGEPLSRHEDQPGAPFVLGGGRTTRQHLRSRLTGSGVALRRVRTRHGERQAARGC